MNFIQYTTDDDKSERMTNNDFEEIEIDQQSQSIQNHLTHNMQRIKDLYIAVEQSDGIQSDLSQSQMSSFCFGTNNLASTRERLQQLKT